MSRRHAAALVLTALIGLPTLADVPVERVPEQITSPEFIIWLPVQQATADAEIAVALGWQAPDDCRLLRITPAATSLERLTPQGAAQVARSSQGLSPGTEARELTIRRRGGALIVSIDDVTLLHCLTEEPLDGRAGTWAERGATVGDLFAQPLGDITFDEDFFQVEDVPGRWETLAGEWQVGVYWDPLQERDNRPIGASWYQPGEGDCLTATGYDFWDSYRQEATVRLPAGTGGLAFHVAGPDDFCTFEVGDGTGRIVQMRAGERSVLAEGPVALRPEWWYRLRAEVSTGHVRCFVNDALIAEADLSPALTGRVGLWASDAPEAQFDDIALRPYQATYVPRAAAAAEALVFQEGAWEIGNGSLQGHVSGSEVAALPGNYRDCEVSAEVGATRDAVVGLVAAHRADEPKTALIFTIRAAAQPTWQLHCVVDSETTKLAGGPAPAASGRMTLRMIGGRVACLLDGQVLDERFVTWPRQGRAGVYLQGGRASFAGLACRELTDEPQAIISIADGSNAAMPALEEKQFIRPIPNLWRPRAGTWRAQTTEAGPRIVARSRGDDGRATVRFHEITPGEPRLIVDAGDSAGVPVTLGICAGDEPGYEVEFNASHSGFRFLRRGEVVHESEEGGEGTAGPGEIRRDGDWIVIGAREFGQMRTVYAWRDPDALPDGYAEVSIAGGEAQFREIVLASDSALAYKFNRVEPDWQPRSGEWTDHTGMACILWDYWITADGREEPARTWNRRPLPADVAVDVSAAEYTDGFADGDHRHYPYHDVRIALCADPETPDAGYAFVVGADGGRRTVLLRNGVEVASSDNPRFRIVMGGHCNTPRAVRLRAQNAGGVLTLTFNGIEALRWQDPDPLGGGQVGLGCDGCRVIFRDCMIYPAADGPAS